MDVSIKCSEIKFDHFFYKSDKRKIIGLGKILAPELKTGDTININGQKFSIGEIQIEKKRIDKATCGSEVGIHLLRFAKPNDLIKINIPLRY